MKTGSEWWKTIAGLAVLAVVAVGLGLLLHGQRPTPEVAQMTEPAAATGTPASTPTPLPTGTPAPRHLSAAVEVQVQNPEGFGPMHLCGDTMVGDTLINGEQQLVTLDLTTGEMRQVSSAPGTTVKYFARISESWVVWIEQEAEPPAEGLPERQLKVYDRERQREFTLEGAAPSALDLSGDAVVWEEWQEGENNYDVYAHNLRTGQRWTVTGRPNGQLYPRISGSWVIYLDYAIPFDHPGSIALWAYNLESGKDRFLGEEVFPLDASAGTHHAISNGLVVWAAPSGEFDSPHRLMGLDLNNASAQPFLVMPGTFSDLKLFGDVLVYHKGWGMTLYDLQRREQLAVLEQADDLVISGDRVVWWGPGLFYTARVEP